MREAGFVGLAAALIRADHVEWTGTFGYANLETKLMVDEHTPFNVASISKTVVSVVMMQLVEEGKLSLDDAIDGPLGFAVRHPGFPDRSMTSRMLATHTSGIVDDFLTLGQVTVDHVDSPESLNMFALDYTANPEHFGKEPGTERDYSNSGIGVLGAVIEGASNDTVAALAKARVFEPLGMAESSYLLRDFDESRLAVPYSGKRQEGAVPSVFQGYAFYPATSLKTSVHDLSLFLLSFMRFGAASGGARVLEQETAASMRVVQDAMIDGDQAIVWYRDKIGTYTMLGHTGSAVGFSAIMFFGEDTGIGVIVLTNSDAFIRSRLGDKSGRTALYAIAARIADEGMK